MSFFQAHDSHEEWAGVKKVRRNSRNIRRSPRRRCGSVHHYHGKI